MNKLLIMAVWLAAILPVAKTDAQSLDIVAGEVVGIRGLTLSGTEYYAHLSPDNSSCNSFYAGCNPLLFNFDEREAADFLLQIEDAIQASDEYGDTPSAYHGCYNNKDCVIQIPYVEYFPDEQYPGEYRTWWMHIQDEYGVYDGPHTHPGETIGPARTSSIFTWAKIDTRIVTVSEPSTVSLLILAAVGGGLARFGRSRNTISESPDQQINQTIAWNSSKVTPDLSE